MSKQKKPQKPNIKVEDEVRSELLKMRRHRPDRRGEIETTGDVIKRLIADAKKRGRLIGTG